MFSLFSKNIYQKFPNQTIDLKTLVKTKRDNPQKNTIYEIRLLKKNGDKDYRKLKKILSYITPNCVVRERTLSGTAINNNLIHFSNYIYFDFDVTENVNEYKKYFIEAYGKYISLVCFSSSMGGLSVLVRVSNQLTIHNFSVIRSNIISHYFQKEIRYIDTHCSDIGRVMFISHDPDLYVNFENQIDVPFETKKGSKSDNNCSSECILYLKDYNTLTGAITSIIPIKEVLLKIKLKTSIDISNRIVDIIPVDFVKVFNKKVILDGTKHKIYTSLIHILNHLNPELESSYLFSYLYYINNNYAKPPMEFDKLKSLFTFVYSSIKNNPYYEFNSTRTKWVHFNDNSKIDKKEKIRIANEINGKIKTNNSIKKILDAKEYCLKNGIKLTRENIANYSGLGKTTVYRYFKKNELIDLDGLIDDINSSYSGDPTIE